MKFKITSTMPDDMEKLLTEVAADAAQKGKGFVDIKYTRNSNIFYVEIDYSLGNIVGDKIILGKISKEIHKWDKQAKIEKL